MTALLRSTEALPELGRTAILYQWVVTPVSGIIDATVPPHPMNSRLHLKSTYEFDILHSNIFCILSIYASLAHDV